MTLIDRVQELRELFAIPKWGGEQSYQYRRLALSHEIEPLVDVLSGFQEGDANGLGVLIEWLDSMQKSSDFVIHPEIMQLLIRHRDEARGLEDRVTQLKMDCDQQHKHAMEWQEEAAKWWQIAIEKGAIIKFLQEAHSTKIQLRAAKAQMKHWDQLPDVFKDSWRKSAARELETASSEHFSGSTKMIELTPERRTALEYAIFAIEQLGSDPEVLRGMLKEAEGE